MVLELPGLTGGSTLPVVPTAPTRHAASPSTYAAVGTVGVLIFGVGVWTPALAQVPGAAYARFALTLLGGVLAAFGWTRFAQVRQRPKGRGPTDASRGSRPREELPSLEIYTPPEERSRSQRRRTRSIASAPVPLRARAALVVVALLLLTAVYTVPLAFGVSSTSAQAPTTLESTPRPSVGASDTITAGATPVCSTAYPPPYAPIGGLYPPLPDYLLQSPCKTAHDEVHLTFSSPAPGSGAQVKFPIHLPSSPVIAGTYGDVYLGMVVSGDAASVGGQSYAELVFTPGATPTRSWWNVTVAVWSFHLNTTCSAGLNVSYQNLYGCVDEEVNGTSGKHLVSFVPGNQSANVTWEGPPGGSPPYALSLYFNDSTSSQYSRSFTLKSASTGTYTFSPAFPVACTSACVLNWSTPFGLGVGLDLCDTLTCFSYNGTTQSVEAPIEFDSPESWTGLNYTGDYRYLGPASSTGACSGASNVVPCDPLALAGTYPFFTFNGSSLEFGGDWTWTTEAFGGAAHEFNGAGTMNQFTPLWADDLTNSSRAGYLAPGTPLNVSVRVQDVGTLYRVNLSYAQPNAAWRNSTMHLASGLPSDGFYNGSIPSVTTNGTVDYRVWVTNGAGATVGLPAPPAPPMTVNRTTVPDVTIDIETVPAGCGGVSVNGGSWLANGSSVTLLAGTYPIGTNGCYPYHFAGWQTRGGLSVDPVGAANSSLLAHANGTIVATWQYYRPIDTVRLAFSPVDCGSIVLNGTTYFSGTAPVVGLLDEGNYSLGQAACSGDSFSGWSVSNGHNLSILGGRLSLHGNGTLTALFVPTAGTPVVTVETVPSTCGGVLVRSVGYRSGTELALPSGSYAVGPDPCSGWGFAGNISTTGAVAVTGLTLSVNGNGSVTFAYYPLTLVTIETYPATCGGVLWDGAFEGDGTVLNVTNHTDHSISAVACSGAYFLNYSVSGGIAIEGNAVVVNGPGSIEAVFRFGTPSDTVGFITDPLNCGTIIFNGIAYHNSNYTAVAPGTEATVSVQACSGYGFVGPLHTTGGIQIVGGTAYVNGSGSITADFHPDVLLAFFTQPSSCGAIVVSGQSYANNATAELPEDSDYPIVGVACSYMTLSHWIVSAGSTIANGTLSLAGATTITAVFVPALYSVRLTVVGGGCGEITVGATEYANNTTLGLAAGSYPISAAVCSAYVLTGWQTTSNLTVTGSASASLRVLGNGTLFASVAAVPPSIALVAPTSAAVGASVVTRVSVAVPVPPYDYKYEWSFGDGTNDTTPSNLTSHVYHATGTYALRVTVVDPLGRAAVATTNITIVAASSVPVLGATALDLAFVGAAAGLVAAATIFAVVRARRHAAESEHASSEETPVNEELSPSVEYPR